MFGLQTIEKVMDIQNIFLFEINMEWDFCWDIYYI